MNYQSKLHNLKIQVGRRYPQVKGSEIIMPRAAKPTSRPKPTPVGKH